MVGEKKRRLCREGIWLAEKIINMQMLEGVYLHGLILNTLLL